MKVADFDILKTAIQQQVTDGIRTGRYKMDHVPSVQFELGYKFEFENGQIKLPKETRPTTEAVWGTNAQFILQSDIEQKFRELFEANKFLTKELCNAILDDNGSKVDYLRDVLRRKESGETLYSFAEAFFYGIGIDIKEFSFVVGDLSIELKRLSYNELVKKATEGELWFKVNEINGFHCKIKIPFQGQHSDAEAQRELKIFQRIVSFLGNGIIQSDRIKFHSEDRLGMSSSIRSPNKMPRSYYCLSKYRLNAMANNYAKLRETLKKASFLTTTTNPAKVAYERYSDAIFYQTHQKQIAAAMMGLEALFTRKGPELSYSLRMRANTLLKLLGNTDIREHLKVGYDARSEYAHGKAESDKTKKSILKISKTEQEFASEIIRILRISILTSLLLEFGHSSKQTEQFQDDLDNVMALNCDALLKIESMPELNDIRMLII